MTQGLNVIDDEIRYLMGNEILIQANLPIRVEGQVMYNGKLSAPEYRKIFPMGDNFYSAYLTIKDNCDSWKKNERNILNLEMLLALIRQDFERAQEIKEKLIKSSRRDKG